MNKNLKMKMAFTLAEVLITLGIIGIVSILLLSRVFEDTQKKQTALKLQKSYSVLYNAYKFAVAEHGVAENWDYSLPVKDFYIKYLSPYLIEKICDKNEGMCKKYKNNRCPGCDYNYYYTPAVILADGTYLAFAKDNGFFISLDINGPEKPNTYGRDIFNLQIHNVVNKSCHYKDRFGFFCQWCGACQHAGGTRNRTHWTSRSCSKTNATSCGGLIEFDGWKISDDYPW